MVRHIELHPHQWKGWWHVMTEYEWFNPNGLQTSCARWFLTLVLIGVVGSCADEPEGLLRAQEVYRLETPNVFRVTGLDDENVQVEFTREKNASFYRIQVVAEGADWTSDLLRTYIVMEDLPDSIPYCSMNLRLNAGARRWLRIRAEGYSEYPEFYPSMVRSPWSNTELIVARDEIAPDAVMDVHATDVDGTSWYITWSATPAYPPNHLEVSYVLRSGISSPSTSFDQLPAVYPSVSSGRWYLRNSDLSGGLRMDQIRYLLISVLDDAGNASEPIRVEPAQRYEMLEVGAPLVSIPSLDCKSFTRLTGWSDGHLVLYRGTGAPLLNLSESSPSELCEPPFGHFVGVVRHDHGPTIMTQGEYVGSDSVRVRLLEVDSGWDPSPCRVRTLTLPLRGSPSLIDSGGLLAFKWTSSDSLVVAMFDDESGQSVGSVRIALDDIAAAVPGEPASTRLIDTFASEYGNVHVFARVGGSYVHAEVGQSGLVHLVKKIDDALSYVEAVEWSERAQPVILGTRWIASGLEVTGLWSYETDSTVAYFYPTPIDERYGPPGVCCFHVGDWLAFVLSTDGSLRRFRVRR